jgi:hypothetical protein
MDGWMDGWRHAWVGWFLWLMGRIVSRFFALKTFSCILIWSLFPLTCCLHVQKNKVEYTAVLGIILIILQMVQGLWKTQHWFWVGSHKLCGHVKKQASLLLQCIGMRIRLNLVAESCMSTRKRHLYFCRCMEAHLSYFGPFLDVQLPVSSFDACEIFCGNSRWVEEMRTKVQIIEGVVGL